MELYVVMVCYLPSGCSVLIVLGSEAVTGSLCLYVWLLDLWLMVTLAPETTLHQPLTPPMLVPFSLVIAC